MLRSGNDCAATLAVRVSGSIKKFAEKMNQTAMRAGALHTRFKNPHGLPEKGHYTTARDLSMITALALENKTFAKIVNTRRYEPKNWTNKNKMLAEYDGAFGVKTGYTKQAGRCLVSAAERNGMSLICTALNCSDTYGESKKLLDDAFAAYDLPLLQAAESPVPLDTKAGKISAKTGKDLRYPLLSAELPYVKRRRLRSIPRRKTETDGKFTDSCVFTLQIACFFRKICLNYKSKFFNDVNENNKRGSVQMRINKFLAEKGVASRRGADEMIRSGRVTVNGKPAEPGTDISENDKVEADGVLIAQGEVQHVYYVMNKPKGVVCTMSDDRGRKTVADLLPEGIGRVFPVGRLDYDTEGLLILTNDGDLAYALTHPSREVQKTYLAKIEGVLTEKDLNPIRSGIELDGVLTHKCKAHIVETNKAYTKVHLTITEGRNREIRRMFEAIGKNVSFLKRIKIGTLTLSGLDRGKIRPLTDGEVSSLKNL